MHQRTTSRVANKVIRLGFIGCGGVANHHARTIRQFVRGIVPAAAADISPTALRAFGVEHGIAALYSDYRKMLREAAIDAVCVALPTGLHAQATLAAAHAGKHVFCEKPMAMSLHAADAMIAACREARVVLMIGHVRRYDNEWLTFRRLVHAGIIGRPVFWREAAGGAGRGGWFMDARLGGGPFLDKCVHNWDFANFVFGQPCEALGSIMHLKKHSAADTGAVIVRYRSGDEIMVSTSWGLPSGCQAGGIHEALGPRGVIKFPRTFPESELPAGFDREKYGAFLVDLGGTKRLVKFRRNNLFAAEWRDFLRACRGEKAPEAHGAVGRQALAVGLAVVKAGKTRRPVRIT